MRALTRVLVFARDMDRLVTFYRDVLGLSPAGHAADDDGFVTLNAGGCEFSLLRIPPSIADSIQISDPPEARSSTPIKLAFFSEDVDGARAALVEQGVVMREVVRFGEFVVCDGLDPEGNVFQLTNR